MNKSVSVAELLTRGVVLRPFEAVAIARALIQADPIAADPSGSVGPPTLSTVRLAKDGTVSCYSCGIPPSVSEVALLLNDMLRESGVTGGGGLRDTLARALLEVDAPSFESIAEFSRALERYAQDEPDEVVRDLWNRANRRRCASTATAFRHHPERRRTMPSATALRRDLREADLRIYELLTAEAKARAPREIRPAPPVPSPAPASRRGISPMAFTAVALVIGAAVVIGRWPPPGSRQPISAPGETTPDATTSAISRPLPDGSPTAATEAPSLDARTLQVSGAVLPAVTPPVVRAVDIDGSREEAVFLSGKAVPDDLRVVTIVEDGVRNHHGRASPDGTRIAFDHERDGERAVYIAAGDGTNVRRVSGLGNAAIPRWAPDGDRLAFIHEEVDRPGVWNLWQHTLTTGETVRLTGFESGQAGGGSWFSDGRRICYSYDDSLVVEDLDSGASREYVSPVRGRLVRTPAVSPDGQRVIFQVEGHGVWLLDLGDGASRVVLTDPTAEDFVWSPDGHRVAFRSERTGGWGIWFTAGS